MNALDPTAIVHLPQALFWGVYWLYSSSMPLASRFATIVVSHDRRVFSNLAARGKTSVDWFFGFKLHLVVNECGELLNFTLTPGNIDDRKPVLELLKDLGGKVFADRGYVSHALAQTLFQAYGIEFFAKPKRNHVATA